uniref:RNA helicase n=1 Tax=Elaeophora elaphi TaxID=1147741 RepID=A0A0R3S525_9BILA
MRSKYGRHKDETGRWVPNCTENLINAKKFGEDRSPYIVEKEGKFDRSKRPEAGHYLDYLLNQSIIMDGPGENVTIVKSVHYYLIGFVSIACFDVIGHAVTGGGKTAAFLIPVINYISFQKSEARSERNTSPYCIVVSPTKELAQQLYEDTLVLSAGLNCMTVLSFGEMHRQKNIADIRNGCDIFICCVGRLCDYLQNEVLKLDRLHFLVLDEADELLLVNGFSNDLIENLLPKCREISNLRKLLFSATDYDDLAKLKEEFLMQNATKVVVGALNTVNPLIKQQVLKVEVHERREALLDLIQHMYLTSDDNPSPKTIIFVNTKRFATVIACYLSLKGYKAYPIHGNLTAKLRREAIEALQSGDCHILVSTDLAARGLDIKGITHIINYEIPKRDNLLYVHRVGRTGRVGNCGRATTFFAPSVDLGMAPCLYKWLEKNKQEIPAFLREETERQMVTENLQKTTMEEYEQSVNKTCAESSDGEIDH